MTDPQHDPHAIQPAQHGIRHGTAGQPAGETLHFTWEEWQQLQRSDLGAGGVVVALMATIFVIGLLLYSTIAYIVHNNPASAGG